MATLNPFLEAWRHELGQALEMMTGQPHPVSVGGAAGIASDLLWYGHRFAGSSGAFAVGAPEHVWTELGTRALQGAGIDLIEASEARSTWFELVQQSISGAVRAVSHKGGQLELAEGDSCTTPPERAEAISATVGTPDGLVLELVLALSLTMEAERNPEESLPLRDQERSTREPARHRSLAVLLDVQLPVSISFGQTQLRLKDVLKLTTGSVVELNRQPEEPVDIIVNDSVIARGEVVVVDGNYAVRIQEIAGRQQRLGIRDRSPGGRQS